MDKVRVRFAPSPTGKLHIGGARTAIYNWALARATGGTFVLRIEDTDPKRSTQENIDLIIRAMRWLGLDWDEGPQVGGDFGPYLQTKRFDTYKVALDKLIESGNAYPCFCTSEEIALRTKEAHEAGKNAYDPCRDIDFSVAKKRIKAGQPHVWRLKVPEGRGDIVVHDAIHGDTIFDASLQDDMIIVRSDGSPTYNFAVVCDDVNMQITHVIRGDDHMSNTPRQILVYEALGYTVPTFAHLPMICGEDGKKLSKRHGAASVEEYRDMGYLSDALFNYLALLGWAPDGETTLFTREEMAKLFTLDRVSKNPSSLDLKKLDWINNQYIRKMGKTAFAKALIPLLVDADLLLDDLVSEDEFLRIEKMYELVYERINLLNEAVDKLAFLFVDKLEYDEASVKKILQKPGACAKSILEAQREIFADFPLEFDTLQTELQKLPKKFGVRAGLVFQPLRVALTGSKVSPPLVESAVLMQRKDILSRLDAALKLAVD